VHAAFTAPGAKKPLAHGTQGSCKLCAASTPWPGTHMQLAALVASVVEVFLCIDMLCTACCCAPRRRGHECKECMHWNAHCPVGVLLQSDVLFLRHRDSGRSHWSLMKPVRREGKARGQCCLEDRSGFQDTACRARQPPDDVDGKCLRDREGRRLATEAGSPARRHIVQSRYCPRR